MPPALGTGIGAAQKEAPVGVLRKRRPGLLAVDDVVVAVPHGSGLEIGKVRACARFRIALAPPHIARDDAGEVAGLLLGIAEGVDHGADHRDAEGQRHDGAGAGVFFRPDVALGRSPAGAAIFDGPCRDRPALAPQDLVPGEEVLAAHVLAHAEIGEVLGIVFGDEGAHFLAEGLLFGGELEVHGGALLSSGFVFVIRLVTAEGRLKRGNYRSCAEGKGAVGECFT